MIRDIKITTLTPVHIGSGIKYPMNIEAVFDGERLGILSPDKVIQKTGIENIQKWTSAIENKENIWDFLQRFGTKNINEVCRRTMVAFGSNIADKKDLKEQLISVRGNPLLPGSSIKGAIRTAILSFLLEEDDSIALDVIDRFKKKIPPFRWSLREYQIIERSITNLYFNGSEKNNANKDVLRFLQITDAEFRYETIATNVKILNLERNGWTFKSRGDQVTEAIGTDSETKVRIKINETLLEKNIEEKTLSRNVKTSYLSSLSGIFHLINDHTRALINKEIELWESEIEQTAIDRNVTDPIYEYLKGLKNIKETMNRSDKNTAAVLRIGGNTGWDFITGAWIKNNSSLLSDEEWEKLYKQLNKGRNVDIFPKTRKLDEDGDFFGFVKIELL